MKTKLEVLNTIAAKHGHESWSKATFFIHERFLDDVIFEAMDLYAEQAQLINDVNGWETDEGRLRQRSFALSVAQLCIMDECLNSSRLINNKT